MLPILYQAASSPSLSHSRPSSSSPPLGPLILLTPLFFGLAHTHHALQRLRDGVPARIAFLGVCLQIAYTSIFGWHAAFLFLRTGSLLPCVLTHSFCNLMGLPNLAFLLPPPSLLPPPPSSFILHAHRGKILGVYALGIGLFAILLYPCSDPQWYYREEGPRPLYWR
ncbi:caax prenyl protease 2 [Nannochloropsis gaditana]|uniref:intramembrane prenyl-peptidase Rce1 n=1 Tax=Nannochloropsis gaditana TaxID=72520 RepID=W7U3S5_9STRA|nr:caax prenyl protease 2 [Nannochloropsis gaditana]